jgi:hypothetical protein
MPDNDLIEYLSALYPGNFPTKTECLDFRHLGVPRKSEHKLHLYTDAKKVPGSRVFRLVIKHRTIAKEWVRYLPGDSVAQVLQVAEQHLHQFWGDHKHAISCAEHTI